MQRRGSTSTAGWQPLALPDNLKEAPAPDHAGAGGPAATPGAEWLATLTGTFALEVGEVIYRSKAVRNVVARAPSTQRPRRRAEVHRQPAGRPRRSGEFHPLGRSVASNRIRDLQPEGQKLRETLSWLDFDVSSIPADKLTRLSMKGRMGSSAGNITVSDAAFELDEFQAPAAFSWPSPCPLSIVTHVELGRLDLDAYLPPPDRGQVGFQLPADKVTPILALLGPSIGLKLKVDRVDWQGEAITGVELDVARAAGTLILNSFRIGSLAGARASLQARDRQLLDEQATGRFAFDFRAPDMDRC